MTELLCSRRTVAMFREDRVFSILFLVLGVTATLPLWVAPFLPLVDLGAHIGAAAMLNDVVFGSGVPARYFEVNLSPTPYWGIYVLLGFFEALGGVFFATKAIVFINVLILPWALSRVLVALGRSPRAGLLGFLIVWDVSMMWGWVAFSLGMALALYTIARLVEVRDLKDGIWVAVPTAAVALTHVHGLAVLATTGVLIAVVAWGSRKLVLIRLGALLAGALVITPWFSRFLTDRGEVASAAYEFRDATWAHRMGHLFEHTFGYFPQEWASGPTACAFLALLLSPILFSAFAGRKLDPLSGRIAIGIVLSLLGLYLLLPQSIIGPTTQVYTYQRLGPYWLVCLSLLPTPKLSGWQVALLGPGVVAAVSLHIAVTRQASEYAENTRPYLEIIRAVPKQSRILPLDVEINDPSLPPWGAAGQLHGWLAGARSSYDPHLFAFDYMPVRYKRPRPPEPNWFTITRGKVDFERLRDHYDYAIVFPKERDPIKRHRASLEHVMDSGRWRLYKIKHETPRAIEKPD